MIHSSLKDVEKKVKPGNTRLTYRFSPDAAKKIDGFLVKQQKELKAKNKTMSKSKILETILIKTLKL